MGTFWVTFFGVMVTYIWVEASIAMLIIYLLKRYKYDKENRQDKRK